MSLRIATHRLSTCSLLLISLVIACEGHARAQKLSIQAVGRDVIEARVRELSYKNKERQANLVRLFGQVGCINDRLVQQRVMGASQPNVICTLPGQTDSVVIVGAHFDVTSMGKGAADNWSGASLLPSLYQSLSDQPRKLTFVFVGFSAEEKGLVGSSFYAKHLTRPEISKIRAMVNLDTLGLAPTEVEPVSDSYLATLLARVALALNLPLSSMDVSRFGTSDYEPFAKLKIPVLSVLTLSGQSLRIIHSVRDNEKVLNLDHLYDTYRLMAFFLAALDEQVL